MDMIRSRRGILVAGCMALVLSGGIIAAVAHEGATGIVKERMDTMEKMGGAMKQIGLMMKGLTPFDGAVASQAAKSISESAAKIGEQFPEGSAADNSYAKKELWENMDEFLSMAKATEMAGKKLSEVVFDGSREEILPLFFNVGKSCKACHTKYRRPKDNQ